MVIGVFLGAIAGYFGGKVDEAIVWFYTTFSSIPGIMLFGLGAVPAIIATVIYAVPPLVRLTDLGITLVDTEVIEAAEAFVVMRDGWW